MRTQRRLSAIVALMVLLLTFNLGACARERQDLPPFDYAKAKTLAPEKRAEYERLLFNEISGWKDGTPRHHAKIIDQKTDKSMSYLNDREAEWLQMAADGYELAYITLQVLKPTTAETFSLDKPLRRLGELADQGDAGAMCLAYELVIKVHDDPEKWVSPKNSALIERYIVRGAERHHPSCLAHVGVRTLEGIHGYAQDKAKGFAMLVEAARQNYGDGAGFLRLYFSDKGFDNAEFVTRQYCWGMVDNAYSLYDVQENLVGKRAGLLTLTGGLLTTYAKDHQRPDLLELAQHLRNTTYTVDDCINLGLGE